MISSVRSFLGVCAIAGALLGCESEGFTPDCPPMPVVGGGPNAPALVEWRKEAAAKKCVTPPGRGFGGASG